MVGGTDAAVTQDLREEVHELALGVGRGGTVLVVQAGVSAVTVAERRPVDLAPLRVTGSVANVRTEGTV